MKTQMIEIHSRKGPEDLISVLARKSVELNDALKGQVRWKSAAIAFGLLAVAFALIAAVVAS